MPSTKFQMPQNTILRGKIMNETGLLNTILTALKQHYVEIVILCDLVPPQFLSATPLS